jgi:hypothetical protein
MESKLLGGALRAINKVTSPITAIIIPQKTNKDLLPGD